MLVEMSVKVGGGSSDTHTPDTRRSVLVLASVLALLFLYAVWPTRYRYQDVLIGDRSVTLRIDRITNEARYWRVGGGSWQR